MSILLAGLGFGYYTLATFFVIVCLLLILMVAITPSSEGGMAAAFGGLGSDSFFGTKAHQQINKFTVFLAITFLLLAIGLNYAKSGHVEDQKTKNEPTELEKKVQEKMPPPPSGLPDPSKLPPPPPPK